MNNRLAIIVRSAQKGGVESHVYQILKHAKRNNFDPTLISLADVPIDDSFVSLGIKTISLSDKKSMSIMSIINVIELYKVLKILSPDVLHCHGTRPIFIGTIAARIANIKNIFITIHNSYNLMSYDENGKIQYPLLLVSLLIHAIGIILSKRIIFVSNYLKLEFVKTYRFIPLFSKLLYKKLSVIEHGIDTSLYKPRQRKIEFRDKYSIPYNSFIIGYVGRIDPKKGIDTLLNAVNFLVDENSSNSHYDTSKAQKGWK